MCSSHAQLSPYCRGEGPRGPPRLFQRLHKRFRTPRHFLTLLPVGTVKGPARVAHSLTDVGILMSERVDVVQDANSFSSKRTVLAGQTRSTSAFACRSLMSGPRLPDVPVKPSWRARYGPV